MYSLMLNAQGRFAHDMFLHRPQGAATVQWLDFCELADVQMKHRWRSKHSTPGCGQGRNERVPTAPADVSNGAVPSCRCIIPDSSSVTRCLRYKLRSDVEILNVSDTQTVWVGMGSPRLHMPGGLLPPAG